MTPSLSSESRTYRADRRREPTPINIRAQADHDPLRGRHRQARANGKKFGRPGALDAGQKRKIAERHAAGATMAELASEYEVGEATIWRALQAPQTA